LKRRYTLRWSPDAIDSLERQIEFVVGRDPVAAGTLIDRVFDRLESLTENPELGPAATSHREPPVRRLLVDSYLVYYDLDHEARVIRILTVRHVRQAPPESTEP
jgi:plasmid stabilization system protein ParE